MAPRTKTSGLVPYDMFDVERTAREVSAARSLERVYHAGQEKIWDGREVLAELKERHGGIHLPPEKIEPLQRILAIIFWGELAAWKVSADLALRIEPLEAKMAATAQAHDEARHFYVLHDYLAELGYRPGPLPGCAARVLDKIVSADHLAKKLVGMQMMVEPIALTLFQMIRAHNVEPVLVDLMRFYERDEARHVALGVNYMPTLLAQMSKRQLIDYWIWELDLVRLEIAGLRELEGDFRALGFEPRQAFEIGQSKQMLAARMLAEAMGRDLKMVSVFNRFSHGLVSYHFPPDDLRGSRRSRLAHAMRAVLRPEVEIADELAAA